MSRIVLKISLYSFCHVPKWYMNYGVELAKFTGRMWHCCQWLVALCLSDCVKCFMNVLLFASYIPACMSIIKSM